jgi:hypothetical protein
VAFISAKLAISVRKTWKTIKVSKKKVIHIFVMYTSAGAESETPPSQNEKNDKKTYVDLDDLVNAGTSGKQNSLDVIAAGLGQDADVALDEVGGGVSGDLAGDEDLAVGADGLGL